MPRQGWRSSATLVVLALPLLIPWNVVGTIWQIFGRGDIGLLGCGAQPALGIDYNYTADPISAWFTVMVMDVWHWTPLVALLCYAGLQSIPDAYYQAARIDGASRWAVFRYIQLPKLRGVLLIAVLLRFMDSFMIYTEPFVVTGGGPGNSTTFLSIDLVKIALGQFDLGKAAALSHRLLPDHPAICCVFYTVHDQQRLEPQGEPRHDERGGHPHRLYRVPAAADLLADQHELQDERGDHVDVERSCRSSRRSRTTRDLHRPDLVLRASSSRSTYVVLNTVISIAVALPAAYAFSRYSFLGDKQCSSGC